jgi:hypothetical protein
LPPDVPLLAALFVAVGVDATGSLGFELWLRSATAQMSPNTTTTPRIIW